MSREQYFSAEGTAHYAYDAMYEYSSPRGLVHTPPRINITYNITETYDIDQIKEYILSLLDENTEQYADQITIKVIEQLGDKLSTDITEVINDIFKEIPLEDIDLYFNEEEES